jgi:hypothetical protein
VFAVQNSRAPRAEQIGEEDAMQTLRNVLVATALMMAAAFPAVAQQDTPPAPGEERSAPQGGTGDDADQQAPGDGMMGGMQGGMMGQGRSGMMGQGGGMMGGMMDRGPMMDHMMCGKRGMRKGHGMMSPSVPMMEGRLAYIKADLEITDAQLPAWNAYADAVRARRAKMEEMHAEMIKAKESGDALQRMDARIESLETTLDSLKASKPAMEALYAALTDEQKKKADQLLAGRCGRM